MVASSPSGVAAMSGDLLFGKRQPVRAVALHLLLEQCDELSRRRLRRDLDAHRFQLLVRRWTHGHAELERARRAAQQEAADGVLHAQRGRRKAAHLQARACALGAVGDAQFVDARVGCAGDLYIGRGDAELVGGRGRRRDGVTPHVTQQELDRRRRERAVVVLQPPTDGADVHRFARLEDAAIGVHVQAIDSEGLGARVGREADRATMVRAVDHEEAARFRILSLRFVAIHQGAVVVGDAHALAIDVHLRARSRCAFAAPCRDVQVAPAAPEDLIRAVDRQEQVSVAAGRIRTASVSCSLPIEHGGTGERCLHLIGGDRHEGGEIVFGRIDLFGCGGYRSRRLRLREFAGRDALGLRRRLTCASEQQSTEQRS